MRNRRKTGFALVIALSLMAFIMLLLISLSAMVQLESSSATNSKNTIEARQMAMLGATIAVGNLQKSAGPDQRVTATGDILSATVATKAKFTGVWDADPGSANYGQVLDWLASRPAGAAFDPATNHQQPTQGDWEVLIEAKRVGESDEVEAVRAQPVGITDADGTEVGRFAWWISDENVKARLDLNDPELFGSSLPEEERLNVIRQLNPASFGGEFEQIDRSDSASLGKVSSREALAFLPGVNASQMREDLDEAFHDFTVTSQSLLTDTRSGGLKKDLSYLFENTSPDTPLTGPVLDGGLGEPFNRITWEQVASFSRLGESVTSGGITSRAQTDSQAGVFPVIQQFKFFASITCFKDTVNEEYTFYLNFRPAVVLANPYDVDLAASDYRLRVDPSTTANYELRSGGDLLGQLSMADVYRGMELDFAGVVVPAGEARVFTLSYSGPDFTGGPTYHYDYDPVNGGVFPMENEWDELASLRTQLVSGVPAADVENATGTEVNELTFNWSGGGALSVMLEDGSGQILTAIGQLGFPSLVHPVGHWSGTLGGWPVADLPGVAPPVLATPSNAADPGARSIGHFLVKHGIVTDPANDNVIQHPLLKDYNMRATYAGRPASVGSYGRPPGLRFEQAFSPWYEWYLKENLDSQSKKVSWGASVDRFAQPSANVEVLGNTFFHVPRERRVSIAELQHFNASGEINQTWSLVDRPTRILHMTPSYAIGNSYPSAFVSADQTERVLSADETFVDLSFLLNDRLFDEFFFSTVPQDGSFGVEDLAHDLFAPMTGAQPVDWRDDRYAAARNLLVEGGFNINSTSVDAWRSLLTAFAGVDYRSPPTNGWQGLFPRTAYSPEEDVESPTGLESESWAGFRHLTASEIDELAGAIVVGVRARGPFLSLADFVNRPLTGAGVGDPGVLQTALDATVNDGFSADFAISSPETGVIPVVDEALLGESTAVGVPSWVLQADLLARIGPLLTPRSDTFTIYVRGGSLGGFSGEEEGSAGLVATVRRSIDWVDPSQSPDTDSSGLNPVNRQFGRSFEVMELQWF